jgi:hypothetical protein
MRVSALMMAFWRFYHDPATHDTVVKLIELRGFFLNLAFDTLRAVHVAKSI